MVGDQGLVTTVDIQADVVDQTRQLLSEPGYAGVTVICPDGALGHPKCAPSDGGGIGRVLAPAGARYRVERIHYIQVAALA